MYETGSRADIRVPMREITLDDTHSSAGVEKNPPVYVYDTSGPYTDPDVAVDVRRGLPALRERWIEERGETDRLEYLTSDTGGNGWPTRRWRPTASATSAARAAPKPAAM